MDIQGKYVALDGRFKSLTKYEVGLVLHGHGAVRVLPSPRRELPVITDSNLRKTLGPPLTDFRGRLQRAFDDWSAKTKRFSIKTLTFGKGCSAKTLGRIEERIGFSLPDDARALFSAIDGVTLFRASRNAEALREPVIWSSGMDQDGKFWRALAKNHFGLVMIPPVETMFFSELSKQLAPTTDDNLFLFDAFSPHYQSWLRVDRKKKRIDVVLSSDYAACFDDYRPLSLEAYLEGLMFGLGEYRHFVHRLRPLPEIWDSPSIRLNTLTG